MKLLFSKTDYHGQWFSDDEKAEGFTEKVPPNTGYEWSEESGDWVEKIAPERDLEDYGTDLDDLMERGIY